MKKQEIFIWKNYRLTWQFETAVFGSFPASSDIMGKFVQKKIDDGKIRPVSRIELGPEGRMDIVADGLSVKELYDQKIEEALETLPTEEEMVEKRSLIFPRHQQALSVRGGTIRAHIKDCARTLSSLLLPKVQGEKSLTVRATNCLYVREDWIPLTRSGDILTAPDMIEEFFVHVRHPRTGIQMSSIKRVEGLEPGASLTFTLAILGDLVTQEELHMILTYGGVHGYGQERSRGMGRYTFAIAPAETEESNRRLFLW